MSPVSKTPLARASPCDGSAILAAGLQGQGLGFGPGISLFRCMSARALGQCATLVGNAEHDFAALLPAVFKGGCIGFARGEQVIAVTDARRFAVPCNGTVGGFLADLVLG